MEWTRKDLLSLYDLSAEEITFILDTAEEFKKVSQRKVKKVPALRGMTVVNFFVEPSTRTRVSFELAEQRLSADIVNMQAAVSSLRKGETLLDTVRNIEALQVDLVVMRHSAPGAQDFIAKHLKCGVVNAGDGAHSHPTQALLDIFTIREKKGRIKGLNVAIVGDILHRTLHLIGCGLNVLLQAVDHALRFILELLEFRELRLTVDVGLHLRDEALGLADPFAGRSGNDGQAFRAEHHEGDHGHDQHFAKTKVKHESPAGEVKRPRSADKAAAVRNVQRPCPLRGPRSLVRLPDQAFGFSLASTSTASASAVVFS